MALNPIVLAVPFYFVGMGVEAFINRKLRAGLYTVDDTLNNLACGLFQQLLTVVAAVALMGPYYWLYRHARVTDWFGAHPATAWATAFVLSDFFYYWFHRWSHESAIGWFSHVVHHQSEEYNLSVALRQDAWQPLFSLWFFLPIALLGVPPAAFATAYGAVIVYQFWIHTRLIGRMGPLEWIFNTPSHHRVHHGVDPKYLDKNYAGVFIIWDRMFGTFEPEAEAPTYGTIEPLASFNPGWSHLAYGAKLARKALAMPTAWDTLQALVRSPGWVPAGAPVEDLNALAAARLDQPKYAVVVSPARRRYVLAAFALAMLVGVLPLVVPLGFAATAALSALTVWALTNVGGVTEARAWALPSERARHALVGAGAIGLAAWSRQPLWLGAAALSWAMATWLGDVSKSE
ncbi:MAG: sterol desaturase family protein [Myxococcaceae bacterium]|nr:sterol desaturase family protein [Myxococcaceae bacterium]